MPGLAIPLEEFLDLQDEDTSWEQYKVDWPEGRVGKYMLVHFEIPRDDEYRIRFIVDEGPGRDPGWGKFTKLVEVRPNEAKARDRKLIWMSDTHAEILEHAPMLARLQSAKPGARVLINGLGLGVVARAALLTENVERVDVVEHNPDIIRLVAPLLAWSGKLVVYEADAYEVTWRKGDRWDLVWHDIWPTIDDENLPGMDRLRRKYAPYASWQGFWQIHGCRAMADVFRRMRLGTLPLEEAEDIVKNGRWRGL